MKMPDPPIFSGERSELDGWLSKMRAKFRSNADHFDSETMKIDYIESRLDSQPARHVQPRMRPDCHNPFSTAAEVLQHLYDVYGDPDRRRTAQQEYRRLKQGGRTFADFYADFQRLTAELSDFSERTLVDDLWEKVSYQIRDRMNDGLERPDQISELARRCQRIDQQLISSNAFAKKYEKGTPGTTSTSKHILSSSRASSPSPRTGPTTASTSQAASAARLYRPPHVDPVKEELMKEGKCFTCGNKGHIASQCPTKRVASLSAVEEIVEMSGK
jgi:hypothetical protein